MIYFVFDSISLPVAMNGNWSQCRYVVRHSIWMLYRITQKWSAWVDPLIKVIRVHSYPVVWWIKWPLLYFTERMEDIRKGKLHCVPMCLILWQRIEKWTKLSIWKREESHEARKMWANANTLRCTLASYVRGTPDWPLTTFPDLPASSGWMWEINDDRSSWWSTCSTLLAAMDARTSDCSPIILAVSFAMQYFLAVMIEDIRKK
jgi:hypothetical protein